VQSKIISALRAFPSGKAYSSCTDLPLYNFIKVVITGELKWLIIWGWPSGLAEKWERIFEEYGGLNPDKTQNAKLTCIKNIQVLKCKEYILQSWVYVLKTSKNQEYIKVAKQGLAKWGYHQSDNVDRILSQLKLLKAEIKEFEEELLHYNKEKNKETGNLTEAEFDLTLVSLSKYFGIDVDSKKITVSKYCAFLKRINEDVANGTNGNHRQPR